MLPKVFSSGAEFYPILLFEIEEAYEASWHSFADLRMTAWQTAGCRNRPIEVKPWQHSVRI